jgi:hypothetical protein
MKKILVGLVLGLGMASSNAQSVLSFDVVFDRVYEASGSFTPNLSLIVPGPFNNNAPIVPPDLTAHVVLSAVASGTQLTNANGALNQITLNGSFSTISGNSPSNGWSTHTFADATFDLYKANSYFATDFVPDPNDWPIFTATSTNGTLADHGPAAAYGGTCPFFFGCLSVASAGTPTGTTPFKLFEVGTPVYAGGAPVFPASFRDSGNYPLIAGAVSQTNPSTGLGFENGMDAFALQGVLDVADSQGNGPSQLYPDGVGGRPGIVRIMTFSSTGNTLYMVEGHVVYAAVPGPATLWLLATGVGLLVSWSKRRRVAIA